MESFFRFSLLSKYPEVIHGVSGRSYGNMSFYRGDQEKVAKNREQFFSELEIPLDSIVVPEMIHGSKVVSVQESERGRGAGESQNDITGADGLVTKEKGLFLMVTSADCFSVFAYDPVAAVVGLAHCGWRGLVTGIISNLVFELEKNNSQRENFLMGIGPGICQKHFVVKNEVLKQFLSSYPAATFVRNKDGYVDLRKAILGDLIKYKVPKQNIEVSPICPVCQNGYFGSHRSEGDRAPISAGVIGIKR